MLRESIEEQQQKAAQSIVCKVQEMENYVSRLVDAAREDFLTFEVKEEEFYLASVVDKLTEYYEMKLEVAWDFISADSLCMR